MSAAWITAATARRRGGRTVAAVRDASLGSDPGCADDAVPTLEIGRVSDRATRRWVGIVRELTASRARILAAADLERRRIEQDLHDGAQQRLVALRIHLELAAERAEAHGTVDAATLHALGAEVDEALEEIRRLTRGIYPTLLT
jgi:signal transduction histidine kinase